ncbi:restriction endonuclease subunit S [Bacillus sp. 2205SS5-2]|uniref:restriction endonuclease subunit S n=1 Tax=Bacillus sp. 2205SS5-2 TaxID=3109031 RepID=UPI00300697F0
MNSRTFTKSDQEFVWEEVKLADVCELISRGITPSYTEKDGVVVINQKCIRDNIVNLDLSRLTNPQKRKIPEHKYLKSYDVLINSTGVGTLGRVAQVKSINDKMTVDSHVTIVRGNEKVSPEFLGYNLFMQQPNIENLAEGSTGQTELSRIRLGETIRVQLPPINEQKVIAQIFSALDQKIETNNLINNKLEEMAQAIFKQWFVDFEFPNDNGNPYKTSGGEMVKSELGMIPKNWEVTTFRSFTSNVLGGDWGKENEQGNYKKAVYCLRGADIPEVREGRRGALPKRYILEKNHINKKLTSGDIVVEISGGSPTQSTGRITYINDLMLSKYDEDFVCTNFCRAITLEDPKYMYYFYFYWKMLYDLNVFFQFENGTTGIKNLDINSFLDRFKIVSPGIELVKRFDNLIRPIVDMIQINGNENLKLSKTRDTLLPKLMSGEIRVRLEN